MNNLLNLKGQFTKAPNDSGGGPVNIPKDQTIEIEHIIELKKELVAILERWENNRLFDGALISVHYRKVVAKSNRISALLKPKGNINATIKGAKFEGEIENIKHVFTHFIPLDIVKETIKLLDDCILICKKRYKKTISYNQIAKINKDTYKISNPSMSKFRQILVDCYYVDHFSIDEVSEKEYESQIVTLYNIGINAKELLEKLDIKIKYSNIIDNETVLLSKDQYNSLIKQAPYLVAMKVSDFSKTPKFENSNYDDSYFEYPNPTIEPIVGVIDTHFDENISFHNWVRYINMMDDPNIEITPEDKNHGTAVTSIIVDGPRFNKELDDECGRFQVRHFGVAKANGFSWFSLYSTIDEIVRKNTDIKVWNLSLGSNSEIDKNFISPIANLLDKLQNELDIIFIVAGTNKNKQYPNVVKIGAPADSLNSIVVNSVNKKNEPASYTRKGPVLSFFHKPDIAYYGGDNGEYITVATTRGKEYSKGTSFAAPWITRKIAYLIYVMGFTKEAAKALILDSAIGWGTDYSNANEIGYGVVPIKISDILSCRDDEIKFIINEKAENYKVYTHDLPLPIRDNKYNYYAKATLCYFPKCERNQGVDYTTGEMNLTFGRMKLEKIKNSSEVKPKIEPINNNRQDDNEGDHFLEKDARSLFRKWDNVKHICTGISSKQKAKDTFGLNKWGISVTTKDRVEIYQNRGINFSLVITFREMDGNNCIREFIDLCKMNNWMVSTIDIKNKIDIYNTAEEFIELKD